MNGLVCCFSGHRRIPGYRTLPLYERLIDEITRLTDKGVTDFRCGGALGFDTIAARAVLEVRRLCPHIKLVLMLPCPEQAKNWNTENKRAYDEIICAADDVVYTSSHYHNGCMQLRNRRLADGSDYCVCYLIQEDGGTSYTVRYATGLGAEIINLAFAEDLTAL